MAGCDNNEKVGWVLTVPENGQVLLRVQRRRQLPASRAAGAAGETRSAAAARLARHSPPAVFPALLFCNTAQKRRKAAMKGAQVALLRALQNLP